MQAALPLGQTVERRVYGIAAILLTGMVMAPLLLSSEQFIEGLIENPIIVAGYQVRKQNTPDLIRESTQYKIRAEHNSFEVSPNREKSDLKISVEREVNHEQPSSIELSRSERSMEPKDENIRQNLIQSALTWLGVPYQWGGNDRNGIDCSGLVQTIYQQYGLSLPRTSFEQFRQGVGISRENLKPGDLVFFSTNGAGASHVGIYLGQREFLSATRRRVEVHFLEEDYWDKSYRGSRRILP